MLHQFMLLFKYDAVKKHKCVVPRWTHGGVDFFLWYRVLGIDYVNERCLFGTISFSHPIQTPSKGIILYIKNVISLHILLLYFSETSPLSSISNLYINDLHVCWLHFTAYLQQYLAEPPGCVKPDLILPAVGGWLCVFFIILLKLPRVRLQRNSFVYNLKTAKYSKFRFEMFLKPALRQWSCKLQESNFRCMFLLISVVYSGIFRYIKA